MPEFMLDTDICVYVMTNKYPTLKDRFDRLADAICISSVTLGELWFGVENSARREVNTKALEEFSGRLKILAFSRDAAAHCGRIRAEFKRAGTPVGFHDMMIGAHARSEGLTLVTNNRREFDRVPGLNVETWVS
jgi:tRNA(fMet)-specific endonuclease VapC